MIYNMPKSNIFVQARKLKKFGEKAFFSFKEMIECSTKEFLKYSRKLMPAYSIIMFKKDIEEYYYDYLFEEPDTNPLTRIKLIENTKNQPLKKNQNPKEIIIEITGLNHLLAVAVEKYTPREERKFNLINKLNKDTVNLLNDPFHPKELTYPEQNSISGEHHDHVAHTMHATYHSSHDDIKIESPSISINEADFDTTTTKKLSIMGLPLKSLKEGVQTIEDYLTQSVKNKPFFYFTPVIIQFSNPCLIPYDICYLCGSYGHREDLVVCFTCQEAYHYFCISKAYADSAKFSRIKTMIDWNCPKCKQCQKCHKKSETHDCLICETCDNLYHLNCVYPQVRILFPSYWKCEHCFKCANCGINKIFTDNLSIDNNVIYHEFCEDFKWCYECGLKLAYFKFCKICKKYCQKSISKASPHDKMRSLQYINPQEDSIECKKCSFKYHISCYEEEFYHIKDYDTLICYNCKISDYDPQKMEKEILNKIKEIHNRKKNIRKLLTISESIFNHYGIYKIDQTLRENFCKFLTSFIIEEYDMLLKNQHVKIMLENFELMNEATRLLIPKLNQNKLTIEKKDVPLTSQEAQKIHPFLDFIEREIFLKTNVINLMQFEYRYSLNTLIEEIEVLTSIDKLETFEMDLDLYSGNLVKYFKIGVINRFIGDDVIFPVFEDSILQIPFFQSDIDDYLKELLKYKIRQENINDIVRNKVKDNKMLWSLLEDNNVYFEKDYLARFMTFNSIPVQKESFEVSYTKSIYNEELGPKSIIVDPMINISTSTNSEIIEHMHIEPDQRLSRIIEIKHIEQDKRESQFNFFDNLLISQSKPKQHNELLWLIDMMKMYFHSIVDGTNVDPTLTSSKIIKINKDSNEEVSHSKIIHLILHSFILF